MLPSVILPGHPDYSELVRIRDGIAATCGGLDILQAEFPQLVRSAIDFVLDPVRTGRTRIEELDNVEKTFVGLKIEHFVRDVLKAPKGIRDLVIDGKDVDVKNTLDNSWMIPPETFMSEDPCLVINSKEKEHTCWMGLMLARQAYLNKPNRDGKRGVRADAVANVLWIVEGAEYPESVWLPFDMAEFRRLREEVKHGTPRISEFLRKNLGVPVHRTVIESLLFDQLDPMKRIRGNGGARDLLRKEQIAVLSNEYGKQALADLHWSPIGKQETIAIAPRSVEERTYLVSNGYIDP